MQELGIFYLAGKTGQTKMGEGICEHMQVQTASVHALGITAVGRSGELRLGHGAAINGTAVVFHPVSEYLQGFFRAVIQIVNTDQPEMPEKESQMTVIDSEFILKPRSVAVFVGGPSF